MSNESIASTGVNAKCNLVPINGSPTVTDHFSGSTTNNPVLAVNNEPSSDKNVVVTQDNASVANADGNNNLELSSHMENTDPHQDKEDTDLIDFFESRALLQIGNKGEAKGANHSSSEHNTKDVIEAYKLLCQGFHADYDVIKKRESVETDDKNSKRNNFFPSPSDILVSKDGRKHTINFIQNNVVKHCSMYAFEDLCSAMSEILHDAKKSPLLLNTKGRKLKQDLGLASNLLKSVTHITHGLFLGSGGSYTKKIYARKISDFNAKHCFIKNQKLYLNHTGARNQMLQFLDRVEDRSTNNFVNTKPKRITLSCNKGISTGSVTVLNDNKIKLVFTDGVSITIDGPMKANIYSPIQLFQILDSQIEKQHRNKMLMLISNDVGTGLVPVSYEGVRKAWYRFRKTQTANKFWRNLGRRPLATDDEIEDFKNTVFSVEGNTMSDYQIDSFLNRKKRKQMADVNNFAPSPVSKSTLGMYKRYMSADYDIVEKKHVNFKDEIRYASETSLRMVVSYIMAVAVTHLIPGIPCPSHPANTRYGSEGAKLLSRLVSRAEGVPNVYPINPAYITSTDDTVLYITDVEEDNESGSIRLALRDSDHNSRNMKSKNYFITAKKALKMGIRVKLTYTFAANGNTAALFVIISGLKESQMPTSAYPSGCHVEVVPGLSTASAIDPQIQLPGYIVFVRSGKNPNDSNEDNVVDDDEDIIEDTELCTGMQNCVKFYSENILLPFIKNQRLNCSYTMSEDEVDDGYSNSWFDGDMNQVKVFKSKEFLDLADDLDVNMIKQNAKRTTSEQSADMGDMFKQLNSNTKKRKALNLPPSHIFGRIKHIFDNLSSQKKIKIESRKRKLLVSFLSDLPQISLLSTSRNTVITGFVRNGMLDFEDNVWPDINQMLNTLGYKLSDDHFHLLFDNFQRLYETMRDCGDIPETLFDELGFPLDTTSTGEVIHRNYGISQEWCHRCKIMSSGFQRDLRKERFQIIRTQNAQKLASDMEKRRKKLDENKAAEEKIICKMTNLKEAINKQQRTDTNTSSSTVQVPDTPLTIQDCFIEAFDAPRNSELEAFIHVRKYTTTRVPSGVGKWPAKQSVSAAKKGDKCLILLAFQVRCDPIVYTL